MNWLVWPRIDGSNTLMFNGSFGFISASLEPSNTKPADSTSCFTTSGSIRCSVVVLGGEHDIHLLRRAQHRRRLLQQAHVGVSALHQALPVRETLGRVLRHLVRPYRVDVAAWADDPAEYARPVS